MNDVARDFAARLNLSRHAAILLDHLVGEAGLDYSHHRAMEFTGLTFGEVERGRSELKHSGILGMTVGRPGFRLDLDFPHAKTR